MKLKTKAWAGESKFRKWDHRVVTEVIIVGEKRAQSRKTFGAPMLRSTAEKKHRLKRPMSSFFFFSVFIYYLAVLAPSCPREIIVVAQASLVAVLGLPGFSVACGISVSQPGIEPVSH